MRILCTGPGTYTGAELEEGRYYEAVRADTPTEQQNRAFHALLQEFYRTGLHSYDVAGFEQFRNCVKRDLGAGFCAYEYLRFDGKGWTWEETDTVTWLAGRDDILHEPDGYPCVKPVLKSWAKYSKKERRETIDRLISAMIQAGVNSAKFDEIIHGLAEAEDT